MSNQGIEGENRCGGFILAHGFISLIRLPKLDKYLFICLKQTVNISVAFSHQSNSYGKHKTADI